MSDGLIDLVRGYSLVIQNGRTVADVMRHMQGDSTYVGEFDELKHEIAAAKAGAPAGDDGVVGEAVDMILCLLDLITVHSPETTTDEILEIARLKCEKWKTHYSNSIDRQR